AAARKLAPIGSRTVHQISPIRERAHERNREPAADRFAQAGLVLHVVSQVRERVTLRPTALVGDRLVADGERNRLEAEKADRLGIIQRELDDPPYLFTVDAV